MLDTSWARDALTDLEPLQKAANSLKAKAHGLIVSGNGRGSSLIAKALAVGAARRKERGE